MARVNLAQLSLGSVEVTGGGITVKWLLHEIFSLFFFTYMDACRVECEPLLTVMIVPDRRRRIIPEVVLARRWAVGVSGNLEGGGFG